MSHQVGFFKRKQLPQGNQPDPTEQEGLCENPAWKGHIHLCDIMWMMLSLNVQIYNWYSVSNHLGPAGDLGGDNITVFQSIPQLLTLMDLLCAQSYLVLKRMNEWVGTCTRAEMRLLKTQRGWGKSLEFMPLSVPVSFSRSDLLQFVPGSV